jgi:hypothetical protein
VRTSSFPRRVAIPLVVVAVEAAWLSVWLAALFAMGPGGRSHLPFVAVAIPGALGVILASGSTRPRWPRSMRLAVVLVTGAAGVALSGWALTSLLDGSISAWIVHPWAVAGHAVGGEEALAFFVAVLAWARGLWLGWEEPNSGAVAGSVILDGAAFGLFFLLAALERHDHRFTSTVDQAAVLLLVCSPAALAALALAKERGRVRGESIRPSVDWLAAVLAPLFVVAAVALLIGLAGDPLGHGIGAFFADADRFLRHLFQGTVQSKPRNIPPKGGRVAKQPPLSRRKIRTPLWLELLLAGFVGVVAVLLIAAAAKLRLVRRTTARRHSRAELLEPDGAQEHADSVFSWKHLLDQLVAALSRLLERFRRRSALPTSTESLVAPAGEAPGGSLVVVSVRSHYRRVLRAARLAGHGRWLAETPRELRRRLAADVAADDDLPALASGFADERALHELTEIYDLARYASDPTPPAGRLLGEDDVTRAGRCADLLCESLQLLKAEEAQAIVAGDS